MSEEPRSRSSPTVEDYDRHQRAIYAILTCPKSAARNTLYMLYQDEEASEALKSRIYQLITELSEPVTFSEFEADEDEDSLPRDESPTNSEPAGEAAVESQILEEEEEEEEEAEEEEEEEERSPAKEEPRQMSPAYAPVRCIRCEELFDIDDEAKGCCYHLGVMRLNHQSYAWEKEAKIDPSECSSNLLDTAFYREFYPNGFRWTCCGQPGGRPGCRWRRHKDLDSFFSADYRDSDDGGGSVDTGDSDFGDEEGGDESDESDGDEIVDSDNDG